MDIYRHFYLSISVYLVFLPKWFRAINWNGWRLLGLLTISYGYVGPASSQFKAKRTWKGVNSRPISFWAWIYGTQGEGALNWGCSTAEDPPRIPISLSICIQTSSPSLEHTNIQCNMLHLLSQFDTIRPNCGRTSQGVFLAPLGPLLEGNPVFSSFYFLQKSLSPFPKKPYYVLPIFIGQHLGLLTSLYYRNTPRPPNLPSPISLLLILGKILEKLPLRRLYPIIQHPPWSPLAPLSNIIAL